MQMLDNFSSNACVGMRHFLTFLTTYCKASFYECENESMHTSVRKSLHHCHFRQDWLITQKKSWRHTIHAFTKLQYCEKITAFRWHKHWCWSVSCPPLTIVELNEVVQVRDSMKTLTHNPIFSLHYSHEIQELTQLQTLSKMINFSPLNKVSTVTCCCCFKMLTMVVNLWHSFDCCSCCSARTCS